MAARAIWKGELKVGSTTVPVKVYAGVQDRDVHFHMVQSKSKTRVKQEMVTEDHQHLGKADVRKGYEVEPGSFVILAEEELQPLKPKESRTIGFSRFVPPSALGNEWYERPYYLGPDGDETKYFALAEALASQELVGIARWSMRGKSYVGALCVEGDYLVLIKLRYSQEVLSDRELPAPEGRPLAQNEFRMAEELVTALEGSFDPKEFRDEYRERLHNFIEAKAKGKSTRLPVIKERTTAASLDQQLAKSLAAMKRTGKETGKEKKVA
jgi:DNA end-binding protein Ku